MVTDQAVPWAAKPIAVTMMTDHNSDNNSSISHSSQNNGKRKLKNSEVSPYQNTQEYSKPSSICSNSEKEELSVTEAQINYHGRKVKC